MFMILSTNFKEDNAPYLQARPLDVEKDMKPVIEFFLQKNVSIGDIVKVRILIIGLW